MAADLFGELGIDSAPGVAEAPAGRDLFSEFGVAQDVVSLPAEGSSAAGRDLFQALGVAAKPGILDEIKSAAASARQYLSGVAKQAGQDIASFFGSRPSVMKNEGRDLLAEFRAVDALPARADPRDVAVGQRALQSIVDENRRRDIGEIKSDDRVIDTPFRKPLARVAPEGVLSRVTKDVASGVTGLGVGFAGAAEWLTGSSNAGAAAKYLEAVTQNLTPDDPNFGDELAAGAGSFAAFFLPGLGVAKGAQAIGKVNTVLANWLGAGSSAALEASAEAGAVYRDLRRQGRSVEQASRAATSVFWSNAALVGVTNKAGLFSEAGGAVRRGVTAAATEGFQEGSQQAISNVATGRPVTEGVGTSAAIGAVLGGGAGAVMGARSRPTPAGDVMEQSVGTADERTVPESSATLIEQQKALAEGRRPVQMFPVGTPELPLPRGMKRAQTERGVFHYNPSLIDESTITRASAAGRENEILGLGPVSKAEAMASGQPVAVVERTPGGIDVVGALTTPDQVEATRSAMQAAAAPGNTIGAEPPGKVIAERLSDGDPVDVSQELGIEPAEVLGRTGDAAAQEAATSPRNDLPEPTAAQKEALEARKVPDAPTVRAESFAGNVPPAAENNFRAQLAEDVKKLRGIQSEPQIFPAGLLEPEPVILGKPVSQLSRKALDMAVQHGAEQVKALASAELERRAAAETAPTTIDEAAHEAATSPLNSLPQPTEAQKESGNYRKGHINIGGLGISVENPAGSKRRPEWPTLESHYGYVKGVPARAPDKDHVDVFVKPGTPENYAGQVFVVDQNNDKGTFDEPKVMVGFDTEQEARAAYLKNYTPGWESRIGGITEMSMDEFKAKLQDEGAFLKPQLGKTPVASAQAAPQQAQLADPGDTAITPGVLAATAVPRRTYTPSAAADVDTDQARPDAIREAMRTLFNVPINERGVTVRRAAGIYKIKPQTIRVRNQNDIDVISHELGHHFSETNQRVRLLMEKHSSELLSITPDAYAKEPKALRREEGFAEFVRLYLTQPDEARQRAPQFLKGFDAFVNDNPHYRAAFDRVKGMVDQWFRLDPAERILAKVGGRPKPIVERLSEAFGKDRLIFEALDNWLPLKRMVADLNPNIAPSKDPFKAAHLLAGDAALIEDWLVSGTVPFDPVKRANPADYGKPLHDILKPVANELRPFSAYLIARRAQELQARGKERLFTDDEIRAGLTLETPAFKAAAAEIYAYNDRLLDYAVEGGLLSWDVAAKFREYTAYIPFFRESEDSGSGRGKGGVLQRLRGGTSNVRDPISNIIQNTANIIHATNRNAVLAKAYQLAQAVPGGGRWIEAIPMPQKAVEVSTERILEQLKREGVKIDTAMAKDLATMKTFFQPNTLGNDRHRVIVVKINGEPKAIQINNKMLWQALQAFEPLDLGLVGTMLAVPSDLLRAGVTLSPEFMTRNFMRDTLSGFMQSKPGLKPLFSTIGGFKEVATRSDAAKLYRAFGGAYGDLWKGESEQTRKVLERMAKRGKLDPRTILTPSGIIDVLHRLGSISEAGTRIAEFKKIAEAGNINSLIDAAYNAREVSVDFGMHGHNQTIRILTRITPFLNPAMQGFYKMGRTGREQFFTTLLRGSMLAAFSVALFLMNRDKEWYDEIEPWERNVYWHFDVGLRTDEGRVIPLRLPKPFEWGALFGSIPEALAQVATDLKGSKFAERLQSIVVDVFALRTVPTAVLVPAELWANRNTFTDRQIVPESKERLDPELQFTQGTSLTAREVGQLTGTSPAMIDHLIRGFLGTLGVYSVMLADQALRAAGDYPETPEATWRRMPVVKAFVRDPDNPNSRHLNEFYELLDKARRAQASYRKYEGDAADAYYEKHREVMDISGHASQAARQISDLRRANEDIASSREYTGKEKRQLIIDNNAMIKEIAKNIGLEARR